MDISAFDPRLAVTGFLISLLIGMTGMGGGALMTPVLILILGMRPSIAVGTDLVYAAITKLAGTWQHHRQESVEYPLVLRLAAGSVPAALLAVNLLNYLRARGVDVDAGTSHMLGLVLMLVAVVMLVRSVYRGAGQPAWQLYPRRRPILLMLVGAVVGFLVGLTSVGSGSLIVVALTLTTALPMRRIVGTDIVHALLLTTAAGAMNLLAGQTDLRMVASLLVGSLPGVLIGSKLSAVIPERLLRSVVALVLLVSGFKLI